MAAITAKKLSYSYEVGGTGVSVLKNVSLEIKPREIVAIQGPSGSGKSTLMHILGCLSQCQKGDLHIDGIDVSTLSKEQLALVRNRKLGFIFQQFHLLPRTTVLDNILLPTMYPFEDKSQAEENKKRAHEIAHKLGIEHRLDHYPNELSGGEQQRVAIARALIRNSKILLADEPTGNLDSKRAEQIMDILEELNREQGLTIILVTHESEVAQRADRIIHLHDGEVQSIEVNKKKEPRKEKTLKKEVMVSDIKHTVGGTLKTILQLIPLSLKNIFRNKARSILTMLGIVIGVGAILIMVTLGQYTERKILESYTKLGANTLSIYGHPNWNLKASDVFPVKFESFNMNNDIEPLKKIFPDISMVSPQLYTFIKEISYAGKSVPISKTPALGVGKDFFRIVDKTKMKMGRSFSSYNIAHADPVCVINNDVHQLLFAKENPLDKIIYISGQENTFSCTVIGVLDKSLSNEPKEKQVSVYMPYTFVKNVTDNPWEIAIYTFFLKAKNAGNVIKIGKAVENYFKSKYGVSGVFYVNAYAVLIAQMKRFLSLFNLMLAVISLITLMVGGIGITNMMLVSISERFKEIGIRKAVGATDYSMRVQFLLESTIICCLAGFIGLLGGFMVYEGIIYIASKFVKDLNFEVIFSYAAILLSIVSMLTVGIVSGLVPALKAEKLEIVTALRSE